MTTTLLEPATASTSGAMPGVGAALDSAVRTRSATARMEDDHPDARIALRGCDDAAWDAHVASHPLGTIFHTRAWQRAVARCFPHEAYDIHAIRGDRVTGLLPMYHVRAPLLGSMLVSVPYGVGGGVLADDPATADAMIDEAIRLGEILRVRAIDLRSSVAASARLPCVGRYVGFSRPLPDRVEDVLEGIPRKARAVVRQARDRHRLEAVSADEHLSTAWRLYCMNMRRLGSLSYPLRFLEALLEETPGHHRVSLVHWNGCPVAGLVSFTFRDRVMPYFYGATDAARRCGAAHYVYYDLMEWAVQRGLRVFDFGRSRRDNAGSADFKRFFGFEPAPLAYQRWSPAGEEGPNLTPSNPRIRLARRLWPHLPLWATTALGARLTRYLPG
ncbi:MAG: FemAB family PEP-CTERM system-associated protein [Phycisphaerales bacterium]|nr:FemAB family PEP-CTERM system-associated protein [Phycisphaerales bacterium]